ncbi:quinone oxidoreductase family protein [Steroidobacter sp.]|uniref:quinone oxidoreductase family protein n=1 Tax=Steroidobacter sp. TaxID=1978227 RepID=UPI001A5FA1FD|nr:zinc-binding dehydrogenase [Steroidobacter sp.]MBL8270337.1 zinc-binding dehydrogenase [Steroidobacter sp.]
MKALMLTRTEGPGSVELQDIEKPTPAAGEVRVALRAASLNYRELWISRGQYPGMKLPSGLGADGAGVIDAVGSGVDAANIGREVVLYPGLGWGDNPNYPGKQFALYGMPLPGTLAQYICVPLANAFTKPASLSFEEAACLPTAGLTAWRAISVKARLAAGEHVLITGIGGGVATSACAFAVASGAKVFVTSSSEEKIRRAEQLGAAGGVVYTQDKWGKTLAKVSGGIDVVIDGAPAGSLSQYIRALNMGARVVIYGSTGGVDAQFSTPDLFLRHATLLGTAMGTLEDFGRMLDFVGSKQLKPVIDQRFTLDRARDALLSLESNHGMGKIVVTID